MNRVKINKSVRARMNRLLTSVLGFMFVMPLMSFNAIAVESRAAFKLTKFDAVIKQITGGATAGKTDKIKIIIPEIAEIGSQVGVRVRATGFKNVESITLLAEKNANPMLASFKIAAGTDPFIKSRVKLRQSTNVVALIKADGKYYTASKLVKITIGGCGGGGISTVEEPVKKVEKTKEKDDKKDKQKS